MLEKMSKKEKIEYVIKFLKKRLHPRGVPFYVILATIFALSVIFSSNLFATSRIKAELPNEFVSARREAARVSKDIVQLTGSANNRIREIDLDDVREQNQDTLGTIRIAKQENGWAYSYAIDLSRYLQDMTESLIGIPSANTQRMAYEAIAVELSLVSEFIIYTQNLNEFLESLERSYEKGSTVEEQDTIEKEIGEVNENTKTINKLNKEFLAKMKLFDKSR